MKNQITLGVMSFIFSVGAGYMYWSANPNYVIAAILAGIMFCSSMICDSIENKKND